MATLIVIVLVGSILAYLVLKGGEILRFETDATPQAVMNAATSVVGVKRRWASLALTENNSTFSYHRGANKLVLVFLFLFFIVPGVVYLILSGKKESLSVSAASQGSYTTVQVASNGWRGKAAGRALRSQIGIAAQPITSQPLSGSEATGALQVASDPTRTGLREEPAIAGSLPRPPVVEETASEAAAERTFASQTASSSESSKAEAFVEAPKQPLMDADWYPDPHQEGRLRYWDGGAWTEHTAIADGSQ